MRRHCRHDPSARRRFLREAESPPASTPRHRSRLWIIARCRGRSGLCHALRGRHDAAPGCLRISLLEVCRFPGTAVPQVTSAFCRDLSNDRLCARSRGHSPRPQAGERHARRIRRNHCPRLGARQAHRVHGLRQRKCHHRADASGRFRHAGGPSPRDPRVHEPRASRWR